jgi:hypothetical protein
MDTTRNPFPLAYLAVEWDIRKLLFGKEQLFPRCEDEFPTAGNAGQFLIYEFYKGTTKDRASPRRRRPIPVATRGPWYLEQSLNPPHFAVFFFDRILGSSSPRIFGPKPELFLRITIMPLLCQCEIGLASLRSDGSEALSTDRIDCGIPVFPSGKP